jgi:peptide/nickel transport system permease protein
MSELVSAVDTAESAGLVPATGRRPSGGGGLGRYLVIRFLLIIPTVFILVTLVFVLMRRPSSWPSGSTRPATTDR